MEHSMRLHENTRLFRQAIEFAAQQKKILPIYVEKDYWVTLALHTIFNSEIGIYTVFKGGTALSKTNSAIERFSEDIDLAVLKEGNESGALLNRKIKKMGETVSNVLPEVQIDGLTHKMGMNRKTAHTYNKEFRGDFGQVRDIIVLEASWLGNSEPYREQEIVSMVGEMMLNNGQQEIARAHGLLPFNVKVLVPERTVCEKIMSLVRFSYAENPIENLQNKIRHIYDLHQLLKQNEFSEFLDSPRFDEMLLRVASDDAVSFKNNNAWLGNHPVDALIFQESDSVWEQLAPVYNGDFSRLVYGELPNGREVSETLKRIKLRLAGVNWQLAIENSRSTDVGTT